MSCIQSRIPTHMKKQGDSHVIKIQAKETESCETHMIKSSGKDFKASIITMFKNINIYIKTQEIANYIKK